MAYGPHSSLSPVSFLLSLFGKSTEMSIKQFSHFGQTPIRELFSRDYFLSSVYIMCAYWKQQLKRVCSADGEFIWRSWFWTGWLRMRCWYTKKKTLGRDLVWQVGAGGWRPSQEAEQMLWGSLEPEREARICSLRSLKNIHPEGGFTHMPAPRTAPLYGDATDCYRHVLLPGTCTDILGGRCSNPPKKGHPSPQKCSDRVET